MKGRPPRMPFPGPKARAPDRPGPRPEGRRDGRGDARGGERGRAGGLDPELFVAGTHSVEAVLRHQRERAKRLSVAREGPLVELAKRAGVEVRVVDVDVLDALTGARAKGAPGGGVVHQGAVLECGPHPYVDIEDFDDAPSLTLVLDGVEDPRNLGAAARAAYALGAELVVVPRDRAAAVTASAHKASAGALSRIPVARVGNLKRGLELLKEKGAWLVGAEADGPQAPWDVDLADKVALVIGGEDTGLRRLTREACDQVVSIPMPAGDISLNAADAATVLLYEALRQRRAAGTR